MNTAPDFADALLTLHNQYRANAGLSPYSLAGQLLQSAQEHALWMATNRAMTHNEGMIGPGERITDAGYSWDACGENIAAGQGTVDEVCQAWMGDRGHRANILSQFFTQVGFGLAPAGGVLYWCADFGHPAGAAPAGKRRRRFGGLFGGIFRRPRCGGGIPSRDYLTAKDTLAPRRGRLFGTWRLYGRLSRERCWLEYRQARITIADLERQLTAAGEREHDLRGQCKQLTESLAEAEAMHDAEQLLRRQTEADFHVCQTEVKRLRMLDERYMQRIDRDIAILRGQESRAAIDSIIDRIERDDDEDGAGVMAPD